VQRLAPDVPQAYLAMRESEVLGRVLLYLPLDTIVPEEVAFRGVLLGALRRRFRAPVAVVLAAVPFALWHTTLALSETPSQSATQLAVKVSGYFLGGVGFGALQAATRRLSAPLAAHWALNAGLMLLLHPLGQRLAGRGLGGIPVIWRRPGRPPRGPRPPAARPSSAR